MDGARGKLDAIFLGADVGRKLDLVAAAFQFLRQGRRGKEMSAGPARGEKERAPGQAGCSLTCSGSVSRWAPALRGNCPTIGRLRVSPIAKPMVSAMARSDEPP